MSSLFASLGTAGNALDVLEQAMGVVQNNVSNSSTPGYVTQTLQLNAALFDPSANVWGGVLAGNTQSSRNNFAEASVWDANQQVGSATQQASTLQSLQSLLDVSGSNGIPGALSTLYSAFSAWSTTPSSTTAQQQVLSAAQGVAQTFNGLASSISNVRSSAIGQTQTTVSEINQLTSQIANINGEIRKGGQNDSGLQSQLYNNLEQLSNYVSITGHAESDGTVTVLANGQVPLVVGQDQTVLKETAINSGGGNAAPLQQILTSSGEDVTGHMQGGQLGGLLQFTNSVMPSVLGSNTQPGSLNELAQSLADRVNTLLTSGQTGGTPPVAGVPLFTYTAGSPTTVAASLGVSSTITGSQLAAATIGPPSVANGIADQLSQLQNSTNPLDQVNGANYTDFYSSMTANIGALQSAAAQSQTTQTQVLTQAQSARAQVSGVSLNDQAAKLLQFQAGYQAASQALATVKQTIQYLMQMMQSVT